MVGIELRGPRHLEALDAESGNEVQTRLRNAFVSPLGEPEGQVSLRPPTAPGQLEMPLLERYLRSLNALEPLLLIADRVVTYRL